MWLENVGGLPCREGLVEGRGDVDSTCTLHWSIDHVGNLLQTVIQRRRRWWEGRKLVQVTGHSARRLFLSSLCFPNWGLSLTRGPRDERRGDESWSFSSPLLAELPSNFRADAGFAHVPERNRFKVLAMTASVRAAIPLGRQQPRVETGWLAPLTNPASGASRNRRQVESREVPRCDWRTLDWMGE